MNKAVIQSLAVVLSSAMSYSVLAADSPSPNSTGKAQSQEVPEKATPLLPEILTSWTSDSDSLLEARLRQEKKVSDIPLAMSLYQPTYILPYYYTGSPYTAVYEGQTPDDQQVMSSEFKSQFSVRTPLWVNAFGNPNYSINAGYTQLFYWQFYAESRYFRETNYAPEVFFSDHFQKNWQASYGLVHQSNGKGGENERGWNRVYANFETSGENWLLSVKPWMLVFQSDSSDLHNPDIAHYLGHEKIRYDYRFANRMQAAISLTNVESGMQRGAVEVDYTVPLTRNLSFMVQYFNGYGQSLIEYDHRTQSVGVGFSLGIS